MPCSTRLFSSDDASSNVKEPTERNKRGRRVWKAKRDDDAGDLIISNNDGTIVHDAESTTSVIKTHHWDTAVDDVHDRRVLDESLSRICEQVCDFFFIVMNMLFCSSSRRSGFFSCQVFVFCTSGHAVVILVVVLHFKWNQIL